MKDFFPIFFSIIAAGIVILAALFFILPPEQAEPLQEEKRGDSLLKEDRPSRIEEQKPSISGILYSPAKEPMLLTTFWCRIYDEKTSPGSQKEWRLGPYTTSLTGAFKIFPNPCEDALLEIRVMGYGFASSRVGPLPFGKTVVGLEIVLTPGKVALQGRVVDSSGNPVASAVLELSNPELEFREERFLTDGSGSFEIKAHKVAGLFSGKIRLNRTGEEAPIEPIPAGTTNIELVFKPK